MRFWRVPLDRDEIVIPRGEVTIISARCKGCGICETFCPRDVLAMSTGINARGYHFPEITSASECVACGLCEIMCPEFAIFVDGEAGSHP